MSTVPISYATAMFVHKDVERQEFHKGEFKFGKNQFVASDHDNATVVQNPPAKYNSKMMTSIWGEYNRYAAPSFHKNSEASKLAVAAANAAKAAHAITNLLG